VDVYNLELSRSAKKALQHLPDEILKRIAVTIEELQTNPFPHGSIKLTDTNLYRVRVGDYRIVYEVNTVVRIVFISEIIHRKQAYR
jgi:mRNA interferase RelE/StbE